jgi:hypothetical protein
LKFLVALCLKHSRIQFEATCAKHPPRKRGLRGDAEMKAVFIDFFRTKLIALSS